MTENQMNFFEQIKASANGGCWGLMYTRRRPLIGATQSVLLYAAGVWADALDKCRDRLRTVGDRWSGPRYPLCQGA